MEKQIIKISDVRKINDEDVRKCEGGGREIKDVGDWNGMRNEKGKERGERNDMEKYDKKGG